MERTNKMKVTVDTTKIENALKRNLKKRPRSEVFFISSPTNITCGQLLEELKNKTSLAREILESFAMASLRLWILRGGK